MQELKWECPSEAATSSNSVAVPASRLFPEPLLIQYAMPTESQASSMVKRGSYEGGHVVWECTTDLLGILDEEETSFAGKTVLDLGCGQGLLGAFSRLRGADTVVFQDLNADVLRDNTMATVRLNQSADDAENLKCRFLSGSWTDLPAAWEARKLPQCDVLLSSECIYRSDSFASLVDVMLRVLKPDGTAYFAAKKFYFGLDGGTAMFLRHIKLTRPDDLEVRTIRTFEDGRSNIREILAVRRLR
eukprot:GDKH01026877.1.p1 GENE.GDKH01026877.1~~GDKH01026877.1.p1  ORF type:complete len:245 (-),score=16.94 GDKH01026877.1:169-903(-)